jgi:hypothetical protein
MNTIKSLAVAALLSARIAGSANADEKWYIADAFARTCLPASQAGLPPSPLALEQATRHATAGQARYIKTDIMRGSHGNLISASVFLEIGGKQTIIVYARNQTLCNEVMREAFGTASELR